MKIQDYVLIMGLIILSVMALWKSRKQIRCDNLCSRCTKECARRH